MTLALTLLAVLLYLVLRMRRQSVRLNALLEVLPVGIVIQDAKGKICDANAVAERLLGLSRAQLLASEALDPKWKVVSAEGHTLAAADCPSMQTVLTGTPMRDVLIGVAHGDAKRRWLRFNTESMPMAHGGAPGVVSSFVDVTEASAHRRMLQLAVDGALLGTWDWHLPDGQVNYNDQWWQMLGYVPFPNPSSVDEWAALVHPDDLVQARNALSQHFEDPSIPYRCDLRMLRHDGEWAWILTAGTAVERNVQGEVIRMAGVHMDISARKRLEYALDFAAINDSLTGLLNREGLQQRFLHSAEPKHPAVLRGYAVILLGFERFKATVDSLGLSAGDELLRTIAQRLRECLAQENERALGTCVATPAHMGRDKFAVLLEPVGSSADAVAYAERVFVLLSQPYAVIGHPTSTVNREKRSF